MKRDLLWQFKKKTLYFCIFRSKAEKLRCLLLHTVCVGKFCPLLHMCWKVLHCYIAIFE
jgi:hypothetical protein